MAYRLDLALALDAEVRRVALEQIDRGLAGIEERGAVPETVHDLRKRCKKLRGLLRLVRPALPKKVYKAENARYRDAAKGLSGLRDLTQMAETFEATLEAHREEVDLRTVRPVLTQLRKREAEAAGEEGRLDAAVAEAGAAFEAGRAAVAEWPLDDLTLEGLLDGARALYDKAREVRGEVATDGAEEKLHDWRKQAKYHWYHLRLMERAWPPMMKTHQRETKAVTEALGQEHDLAVLHGELTGEEGPFADSASAEACLPLIDRHRHLLREKARIDGAKLFALKPKPFAERLGAWCEIEMATV